MRGSLSSVVTCASDSSVTSTSSRSSSRCDAASVGIAHSVRSGGAPADASSSRESRESREPRDSRETRETRDARDARVALASVSLDARDARLARFGRGGGFSSTTRSSTWQPPRASSGGSSIEISETESSPSGSSTCDEVIDSSSIIESASFTRWPRFSKPTCPSPSASIASAMAPVRHGVEVAEPLGAPRRCFGGLESAPTHQ